ncbi:Asp-tRNA(Asn)/Glu-tRNA(Gln) amidotransferase subunit GatB [bacterium]|nr:Asp-tRNA(Asn)/Glu-tRNA(Gln) amidotransferase subunit GatB [bacterium]
MEFEPVIGLEVHVQLKTKSKLFCSCATEFGAAPNSQVCPVCLGHPGVLPVLNKQALDYAVLCGLALNCSISKFSKFDRKNYFYPDLPKNYQVSQFDKPICGKGKITFLINGNEKTIGITRAHLEEDAGKLVHSETGAESGVDFNRTGIPLLEIVSEPDLRTPEEAYMYLHMIKNIIEYLGVSDCNMEEGSLRCDANVSIRPKGQEKFGTKVEIKNMNSFRNVQKALAYELERQEDEILGGGIIVQETRLWDADKNQTFSMRTKEEAHDYRYFPEPDLVPVKLDENYIKSLENQLPELPFDRMNRFTKEYTLTGYDAQVLTSSREIADYYEECANLTDDYKAVSNWVQSELLREINEKKISIKESKVTPSKLTDMLKLIQKGVISGKIAKIVFHEIMRSGKDAEQIVKEKGLVQISNPDELKNIVEKVIKDNKKIVDDYKGGKEKSFMFLVGQVMKATQGKANPQLVTKMLKEAIG